jgi:GTPase SAR1 family protein/predicted transglutaminase-like cysteine proteinase
MVINNALALLASASEATEAYGRPDLGERVARVRERVTDPRMRVLVVGEFKQGKSSLVNALVRAPLCPVDDDVATSVPTAVQYADEPSAVAVYPPAVDGGEPLREPIGVEEIREYVSEAGNPANERRLAAVEVGLPREVLRSGLVLVDTPGVGGLGSVHSATTVAALPSADAVLLCTDASQELTESEMQFLEIVRDLCPTVACVLTKTDFYPAWRKIAELDEEHLAGKGVAAPVIPTSAALRQRAAARDDRQLNDESGYPRLLAFLRDEVVASAGVVAQRAVAHTITDVTDQLAQRFAAERDALTDPAGSADQMARLQETQLRAKALLERAARWQQTLSDGFADLAADAEHEMRARMRRVTKQVETAIEDADPAQVWEQLEQWLYRATAGEVAAHYATVTSRAVQLAAGVAEHFASDATGAVPHVEVTAPMEMLTRIEAAQRPDLKVDGAAGKALTAMRGSFGGLMMIGVIGSTIGLGLLNPLSLGFGAVLGRKAIKDEGKRALAQRRAQSKQACRAYIDEVSFVVSKDARDGMRRMQRALRDAFTERADELQRTTSESLGAAQQAVQADQAGRASRLRDIDAELSRIRALRARAEALT